MRNIPNLNVSDIHYENLTNEQPLSLINDENQLFDSPSSSDDTVSMPRLKLPHAASLPLIQNIGTPQPLNTYQKVNDNILNESLLLNPEMTPENLFNESPSNSMIMKKIRPRTYSPWTPRGAVLYVQDKIKPGSLKGSIFNIIISTVGGGMLSLSYGFREIGLICGFLLLLLSALLSYYTMDLLLISAKFMPPSTKPTYMTLSLACSKRYGGYLATTTQIILLVQMFGGFISYNVAFGGLLDLSWHVLFPAQGDIYMYVVITMSWLIIFPLSLLRKMSSLRFTSLLGFACCLYLSIVIFSEYWILCSNDENLSCFWSSDFQFNSTNLFNFNSFGQFLLKFLNSFPLFVFSFVSQQFILPVYVELQRKSRARMLKAIFRAFIIIIFMYTTVSIFGFLTFLDGVCGNILLNNFHKHPDVILAAIAISTSMILTQPITTFAWRMNFSELIFKVKQVKTFKHVTITFLFTFAAMIVSLLVTNIATVFSLLGATTYPIIGFILPAVFYLNIVPKKHQNHHRYICIAIIIFITICSIAGFIYQLYNIGVNDSSTDCKYAQQIETPSIG